MNTVAQVWARVAAQSPDQAMGFPMLIWGWGRLVGWSELAARVLPFLAGLLTIAMTYRLGRDLFGPIVGAAAAWVMGTSVYFITFMHYFRVFTLGALAVSVTLWCYWRIALSGRRAGWLAHTGLTLGALGLVYGHYFMAPFLTVLAAYHLLFVPKTRRWWLPVLAALPVVVLFAPQVPVLLRGYAMNQEKDWLLVQAASPPGIVQLTAVYFTNNAAWVMLPLLLTGLYAAVRERERRREYVLVWVSAVGTLIWIIGLNELSGVLEPDRFRYLMGLWVPLALIAGTAFAALGQLHRYAGVTALAVWCAVGVVVTARDELTLSRPQAPPWRELVTPVLEHGEPADVFLYNGRPDPRHGHYTHTIANRPQVVGDVSRPDIEGLVPPALRIWWGTNRTEDLERKSAMIREVLAERDYIHCANYLDVPRAELALYAQSPAFCPGGTPVAAYGDWLTLMQTELVRDGDALTLNTGWQIAPGLPLNTYSMAFLVMVPEADAPVLQQDVGLGFNDGPYTPVQVTFDVSALERGPYDVWAAVYNWQTLERLPAQDVTRSAPHPDGWVQISGFEL